MGMRQFVIAGAGFAALLALEGCDGSGGGSGSSGAPASSSTPAVALSPTPSSAPSSSAPPASGTAPADDFTYEAPGKLQAGATGVTDNHIYAPGIRFPLKSPKAYPGSQLWSHGGAYGPDGSDQCDAVNWVYPWHDTFCEPRDYATPLCPSGQGHQGQDIRPSTCDKGVWPTVAAEAGTIVQITGWKVYLKSASTGRTFVYMHMAPDKLKVQVGDTVARGQELGFVSDYFPGGTSIHLHFEIMEAVTDSSGTLVTNVPPYTSLIDAYQRLLAGQDH